MTNMWPINDRDETPDHILRALRQHLDEYGRIKSSEDAEKIYSLMESTKKIVYRCILFNIIVSTCSNSQKNVDIIHRFLKVGGWNLLNCWFEELFNSKNYVILNELIEMLIFLPMNTAFLRQGIIAKSLKKLSKLDSKPLQLASKKLLCSWKLLVKKENAKEAEENKETKKRDNQSSNLSSTGNSFLQSLSAAMKSSETSRKRRLNPEPYPSIDQSDPQPPVSFLDEGRKTPLPSNDTSEVDQNENNCSNGESSARRVKFKDESELVTVFYFEMTDQERLEMHGERSHINFTEAAHLELLQEKKALQTAKTLIQEPELVREWIKPALIEDVNTVTRGSSSNEISVQASRESLILATIFMDKTQVPITPGEPENPLDCYFEENLQIDIENHPRDEKYRITPYWNLYSFPIKQITKKYFYSNRKKPLDSGRPFGGHFQNHRPPRYGYDNQQPSYPYRAPFPRQSYRNKMVPNNRNSYYNPPYEGPLVRNEERVYVPVYGDKNPEPPIQQPSRQPPPYIPSYEICRHYMKGKCKMGSNCRFRHDS